MNKQDVVRAWKEEEFRIGLSAEQQALLPENPAGLIELTDSELEHVEGGNVAHLATLFAGATVVH
jgi:mersacidin/lichenicidin family type 2 lantibiotic